LTDQDISDLKDWGFNFVRLGVLWEAAETSPGVWNTTYLEALNDIALRLGKEGIYTLVDGH
jgi:endoglycosylceramidase